MTYLTSTYNDFCYTVPPNGSAASTFQVFVVQNPEVAQYLTYNDGINAMRYEARGHELSQQVGFYAGDQIEMSRQYANSDLFADFNQDDYISAKEVAMDLMTQKAVPDLSEAEINALRARAEHNFDVNHSGKGWFAHLLTPGNTNPITGFAKPMG